MTARPHRVAVLMVPPVVGFDATIPSQVFGAATDDTGRPLYDVAMVGLTRDPVPTESGYAIVPDHGPDELRRADTVVVPGTRYPPARQRGVLEADVAAVLDGIRPSARLVSICTGAYVLAAAGRFAGRPASTHWAYADRFRELFPDVDLDADRLFVDDGDLLSSAGVAAGIDLCLHLIRKDHGTAVANRAARLCVVPPWRDGGQAQFIERPVPEPGAAGTGPARRWAQAHLGEPLDVARFAAEARMSVRTFNRRFREETGHAPGAWLAAQRLDHARHLLETTDLSVDEVAGRAGLGSGATLRARLRDAVGLSPAAYRRTFRGRPDDQPSAPRANVSQRAGSPVR